MKVRRLYVNEKELVKACLENERNAQYELYQQFSPSLYPICLRYAGNENDAAEVLSNAFIKIFGKLSQYSFEGSLEGWMKKICVRESLNYIKSRARYLHVEDPEDIQAGEYSDELAEQLDAEELLMLIQELPEGYRTVFNLYAVEGYAHKEISAMLGISESTSKTQLFKARKRLQESVESLTSIQHHGK